MYEKGSSNRLSKEQAPKLNRILTALDQAEILDDMDIPGFRLHQLKGRMKGYSSVWVSRNWRVTFRFEAKNVADVDYIDYHQEY